MSEKSPVSGRETYVLDDHDIEELEHASITGVLRDVTDAIEKVETEQRRDLPDEIDDDDWSSLLRSSEE